MNSLGTAPSAHLAIPLQKRPTPMGHVKAGRKSDKGIPQSLDHFLITTLNRGPDGNFALDDVLMDSLVKNGHGDHDDKIRRLPITLATDDLEQVFQQSYLWYHGKKLGGRSDGKTLSLWFDPKPPHAILPSPWVMNWRPEAGDQHEDVANLINVLGAFRLSTKFNFLIRDPNARVGGVYRLSTVSAVNANQIPNTLMTIHELTQGHLRFLPMELVIRPQPVCPIVKGVPTPSVVHVCHVEMSLKEVREQGGARRLAMFEMKRQLAEAREFKAIEEEFRQLMQKPNPLDEDEDLPQLPPASTVAPEQPSKPDAGLGERYFNTLSIQDTRAGFDSTCETIRTDWLKLPREWQEKLAKLKAEVNERISKQPQEQEEKFR